MKKEDLKKMLEVDVFSKEFEDEVSQAFDFKLEPPKKSSIDFLVDYVEEAIEETKK